MCERTLWHVQTHTHTSLSFLSLFISVWKHNNISYSWIWWLWNTPFPHSCPLGRTSASSNRIVGVATPAGSPCYPVIVFTAIGQTSTYSFDQDVVLLSKVATKINGQASFSTGSSLRTPTNRCPGITPSQWKDTGCGCLCICFTHSKMSGIFRLDFAEMLNEWIELNMHQHVGGLPYWQQVMRHPTRPLLQCGSALSALQSLIVSQ